MITIVDYDAGNIRSVENMLAALGIKSRISSDPSEIRRAEKLILPGVGHFDHGMGVLHERGLVEALNRRVMEERAPILGICLGAQLLTRGSEEGNRPGLGWIAGETRAFDRARMDRPLPVPHMGWSDCWVANPNPLTEQSPADMRFYFVHSFHLVVDEPGDAIIDAHYGYDFVAAIGRGNVMGVQFHPEKSHRFGMDILRCFARWQPDGAAAAA